MQVRAPALGQRVGILVALLGVAVYVGGLFRLMHSSTYDAWSSWLLAPVLVAISVPILARQASRERDRRVFVLLLVALVVKLGGSLIRYYVAFDVYGGIADAVGYHGAGTFIATNVRAGVLETGLETLSGTDFISLVTGVVYVLIGPSSLGGFLVFSWLGFWGLFLFYRAFTIAVPEGRPRAYAAFLFFLPSLVFWPSSTGKEAWMVFALGVAAFGAARLLTRRTVSGFAIAALGLWFAGIVRPHIGGFVGLALASSFLFHAWRRGRRQNAVIFVASALGIVLLAWYLVGATERFLLESGIGTEGGVRSVFQQIASRTGQGGSAFEPSIIDSPARAPIAFLTVLFRPLVFEAENVQGFAAAVEATFLLLLTLARFGWIVAAMRGVLRQPYVTFALGYVFLFVVGFSSFANFGLLARERVQLLPFYLVLLSIPPRASGAEDARKDGVREGVSA